VEVWRLNDRGAVLKLSEEELRALRLGLAMGASAVAQTCDSLGQQFPDMAKKANELAADISNVRDELVTRLVAEEERGDRVKQALEESLLDRPREEPS
jgi:hypothetical protein